MKPVHNNLIIFIRDMIGDRAVCSEKFIFDKSFEGFLIIFFYSKLNRFKRFD